MPDVDSDGRGSSLAPAGVNHSGSRVAAAFAAFLVGTGAMVSFHGILQALALLGLSLSGAGFGRAAPLWLTVAVAVADLGLLVAAAWIGYRVYRHVRRSAAWNLPRGPASRRDLAIVALLVVPWLTAAAAVGLLTGSAVAAFMTLIAWLGLGTLIATSIALIRLVRGLHRGGV